jgi:hypothetical protein
MMRWIFALLVLVPIAANAFDAVYGSDLTIPAGTEVRFKSYSGRTRSYKVFSLKLPGEGIWDVSLESAARSIKTLALNDLKKNPHLVFKKKDYPLDKDMTVLNDDELEARKHQSHSR